MVTSNVTYVDFLDKTFNLKTNSYQPFRKPDCNSKHIDIDSDNPPQILKQLSKSISKRLSENLPKAFGKSKTLYQKFNTP